MKKTKISKVLEELISGKALSVKTATYLCDTEHLRKYIQTLIKRGYRIEYRWINDARTKSRYKEYFLQNN